MAKIVKSKKKKASKFNIFCVVFFTFALAAYYAGFNEQRNKYQYSESSE